MFLSDEKSKIEKDVDSEVIDQKVESPVVDKNDNQEQGETKTDVNETIEKLQKENEEIKKELEKQKQEFKKELKRIGEVQTSLEEEKEIEKKNPYLRKFKV